MKKMCFLLSILFGKLPFQHQEAGDVDRPCHHPGHWIGKVQCRQAPAPLENREDPKDSQAADTDNGYAHGDHGASQAPDTAHHGIHDAAEEVCGPKHRHTL